MAGKLRENLDQIKQRIAQEKKSLGLNIEPKIIAVSKKQTKEKIRAIHSFGLKDFAENYLQEAIPKLQELSDLEIDWHFIGRIQSKKIKDIVGSFSWIHTVSRFSEAEAISQWAQEKSVVQKILVQVNIAKEDSKSGFLEEGLRENLKAILQLQNVQLRGLMFFPPLSDSEGETLSWFEKSSQLFESLREEMGPKFDRLSMGTSQDYHLAMRFGATDLRIGESLMGPRTEPL